MIKKDRDISLRILILQAIMRRVDEEHPRYQDAKKELGIKMAGYNGEKALDYFITLLPEDDIPFLIFHDLRLPFKDTFFQIDTLIINSNFFLILEVKNYRGTLSFDPKYQQLIQETEENQLVPLPDPIMQVKRQTQQLQYWLKSKNLPPIPGEKLVVLTNQKSFMKVLSQPNVVESHVIKSSALSIRVEFFLKKHPNSVWDKKSLRKCSSLLIKSNTPSESSPLEQYNITPTDITKGVFCPNCQEPNMERLFGKWCCSSCLFESKDAHKAALKDYALLVSKHISNREFRDFLAIKSDHTARRLIKNMNLEYKGETQGRVYILPT